MVSSGGAPADAIRFVIDLLNTLDLRTYGGSRALLQRDRLGDPDSAQAWLSAQALWPSHEVLPAALSKRLRELRDEIAEGFGGRRHSVSLAGVLTLSFGRERQASLRGGGDGADGVIDDVIARIATASLSPQWSRVRICAAPDCRYAFYDASRNGRGRWCSMKTCGNRMKTRSYRQRKGAPVQADKPISRHRPRRITRSNIFRLEGEFWSVSFLGCTFRLKDSKGLRHIARLLAEPNREFHVLDLVALDPTGAAGRTPSRRSNAPLLDATARRAYAGRLAELRIELDEAESWNDDGRAARVREEMDFLAAELKRAVGLGDRDRSFASDSERARVSTTRVIRAALARIGEESPELKHHFASTLHTGTYCSYKPDPRLPVFWEL